MRYPEGHIPRPYLQNLLCNRSNGNMSVWGGGSAGPPRRDTDNNTFWRDTKSEEFEKIQQCNMASIYTLWLWIPEVLSSLSAEHPVHMLNMDVTKKHDSQNAHNTVNCVKQRYQRPVKSTYSVISNCKHNRKGLTKNVIFRVQKNRTLPVLLLHPCKATLEETSLPQETEVKYLNLTLVTWPS